MVPNTQDTAPEPKSECCSSDCCSAANPVSIKHTQQLFVIAGASSPFRSMLVATILLVFMITPVTFYISTSLKQYHRNFKLKTFF